MEIKREQILKFECPTCGSWKGQLCRKQNRVGIHPAAATLTPISRLHKARVEIAIRKTKRHLSLVVSN